MMSGKSEVASRRMRVSEAAQYLGVSKSNLDKRRMNGQPPAYSKIGDACVYDSADLDKFLAETKRP